MKSHETPRGSFPLSPIVLFLLLIGWQAQAEAFFCFTFGGHAGHDSRFDAWAWQPPPPPPQLVSPYLSIQQTLQTPVARGNEPPPIKKTKKSPEVIQGYRFRPLDNPVSQPQPISPRDWRD